ncbi:S-adenosylmethionine synthetase like protein, partial [Aduncisulcus paluster]
VIPKKFLRTETRTHLNPSGRFVLGGPEADAGLTGRKIIVDTYGGHAPHGGGAFSGKDFTKVDRSAAYALRYIAKSLVAAKLCHRCCIQVSYGIGIPRPTSIYVNDFGTSTCGREELKKIVLDNFDLRPGIIVKELGLDRPIYAKTASGGHFGRSEFPWEKVKELKY